MIQVKHQKEDTLSPSPLYNATLLPLWLQKAEYWVFFCYGSLAYKGTFEKQYFIESEPKTKVISSKIDQLAAIYTFKSKWAWRAQFLSHTLQILEIFWNCLNDSGIPNQNLF